ncbi:MAG: HD domain-containing protein [Planctomycetota bacterium]|nr:HD domain-containing protein [Planctomycetota bacterium]
MRQPSQPGTQAAEPPLRHPPDDLAPILNGPDTATDKPAEEREAERRRSGFLRRLTATRSSEEAAVAAIDHIANSVGARRISVMIEEQGRLRILASRGIPEDVAARVSVRVDSRICGLVFSTGRAVVFRNVLAEMPDMAIGLEACGGAVSLPLVSAPMGANSRKIGCINVTDHPAGEFSQRDLSELEFTAQVSGISLSAHVAERGVEQANYDTIRVLVRTVEAKDAYTHGHSLRVQHWALEVAKTLGFDAQRLRILSYAGELHDIGKLAVPDNVLHAPRALADSEWAIIRRHPVRGVEMIEHIGFLRPALPAIRHHHEHLDGQGYPDGLAGEEIPLEARILAVVDSYDAMTSSRPYRAPLSHEAAAAELRRGTGTQFDARCVEAFLTLLGNEDEPAMASSIEGAA